MLRERTGAISALLLIVDLLGVIVSFACAYFLRNIVLASSRGPAHLSEYLRVLGIAIPVFGIAFRQIRGIRSLDVGSMLDEVRIVGEACGGSIAVIIVVVFYLKYQFVSRLFLIVFSVLCFGIISAQRLLARWFILKRQRTDVNCRNIIVVGLGERARQISQALEDHRHWGLRLTGFVAEDEAPSRSLDVPVFVGVQEFKRAIEEHVVDGVVFAIPPEAMAKTKEIFAHCCKVGIPVYTYARPFEDFSGRLRMERIAGIDLIAFPMCPHSEFQLFLKRGFDLVLSVFLSVGLAPIMVLAAILIKLESRGPVFFRQVRVGKNGRLFTLYKFRSMVTDAEKMKSSLAALNEMDGPVFKLRRDPRVTRVGRILRRTSVDEFPQLLNVIAGHMSIVGPRPPLVEEVERYEVWHRRRLSVKPGLTCLWQVSGRNELDFRTWMGLDLHYIDNWSWWLDFSILLRTIPAMLRGR